MYASSFRLPSGLSFIQVEILTPSLDLAVCSIQKDANHPRELPSSFSNNLGSHIIITGPLLIHHVLVIGMSCDNPETLLILSHHEDEDSMPSIISSIIPTHFSSPSNILFISLLSYQLEMVPGGLITCL
jgi:hypothetical protein